MSGWTFIKYDMKNFISQTVIIIPVVEAINVLALFPRS